MLAALTSALAVRDPSSVGHARRVTTLAGTLAAWLGWDERRLQTIRIGVPLHDIGKLAVSESILRKPGPLSPGELAEIRAHPAAGARLIDPRGPLRDALPYVLYHHERWDGAGYPTGRSGPEIPEEARLLSVVDAFDAMTTTRPYRRPLPAERAVREVERCAGTQFDPALAGAFLAAWRAGAFDSPLAAAL